MSLPNYEEMLNEAYEKLDELSIKRGSDRFEVPEVDALIEGSRTVFRNFASFCEKIRRDPDFVAKFISKEFGAPTKIEGDRLIIQRRVRKEQLQNKMKLFVDYFVICHECGKPDTKIVSLEGVQYIVCEACGARRPLKK